VNLIPDRYGTFLRIEIDTRESDLLTRAIWTRATGFNEDLRTMSMNTPSYIHTRRFERYLLDLRSSVFMSSEVLWTARTARVVGHGISWCLAEQERGRSIQDKNHGFARVPLTDDETAALAELGRQLRETSEQMIVASEGQAAADEGKARLGPRAADEPVIGNDE
jgi:hypothetical protein